MHLDTAHTLFRQLRDDDQSFIYQGDFSDQITSMIISLVEETLTSTQNVVRLRGKVSFLMVESFQNIIRHSELSTGGKGEQKESFQVRFIDDKFYITSANLISNDKIKGLAANLDGLNILDKKDLKLLYINALDNNAMSEKGGAGLGLIEMARKSGQKLLYQFIPCTDTESYFYLQTALCSGKTDENLNSINEENLKVVTELHKTLQDTGIFVLNKGNFSHEAIKPMLAMVENNLVSHVQLLTEQKILFHLLVELLQNISNHAYGGKNGKHEGIFFMGHNEKGYFITAGNYIANDKIEDLREKIDSVNKLPMDELKALYRKKLREGKHDKEKGAGVGLIDLARFSKTRIEYKLFKEDEEKSFFSIMVVD